MNTKIFLILVLSLSIFGCSDGPNTVLPDGGIFADSDVSPDLSVEDDLGVEVDSDVPPEDVGVEDGGVVTDLGTDLFVPPLPCEADPCLNGGVCVDVDADSFECTCSAGWSGVTCQTDVNGCAGSPCADGVVCTDVAAPGVGFSCGACPVGFTGDGVDCVENQYYVWIASVSWSDFATAESLCAARRGHFPEVPNTSGDRFAVHSQIVANLEALRPPGSACQYPANVSDCGNWCANNQLGNLFACISSCENDVTPACLFHRAIPHSKNLVATVSWIDGNGNRAIRVLDSTTPLMLPSTPSASVPGNKTNLICVLPYSGDFTTAPGLPDYVGVLAEYYTSL